MLDWLTRHQHELDAVIVSRRQTRPKRASGGLLEGPWLVTVVAAAGAETVFTDERYWVTTVYAENDEGAYEDDLSLGAMTSDGKLHVPATNMAEFNSHTHTLPVGQLCLMVRLRDMRVPPLFHYVLLSGVSGVDYLVAPDDAAEHDVLTGPILVAPRHYAEGTEKAQQPECAIIETDSYLTMTLHVGGRAPIVSGDENIADALSRLLEGEPLIWVPGTVP